MELERIKLVAEERLKNRRSHSWKELGNKFYHGERVAKLALELRRGVLPDDASHDDILTAAAWLHDIANGEENHAAVGAKLVRELIADLCTEDELDEICSIIRVHDDRSERRSGYSVWVRLHQDADHLDHFGTYDIWMNCLYAFAFDETVEGIAGFIAGERNDSMVKYRGELNFELSRLILDEKAEYQRVFGERFLCEGLGGVWDLDGILKRYRESR